MTAITAILIVVGLLICTVIVGVILWFTYPKWLERLLYRIGLRTQTVQDPSTIVPSLESNRSANPNNIDFSHPEPAPNNTLHLDISISMDDNSQKPHITQIGHNNDQKTAQNSSILSRSQQKYHITKMSNGAYKSSIVPSPYNKTQWSKSHHKGPITRTFPKKSKIVKNNHNNGIGNNEKGRRKSDIQRHYHFQYNNSFRRCGGGPLQVRCDSMHENDENDICVIDPPYMSRPTSPLYYSRKGYHKYDHPFVVPNIDCSEPKSPRSLTLVQEELKKTNYPLYKKLQYSLQYNYVSPYTRLKFGNSDTGMSNDNGIDGGNNKKVENEPNVSPIEPISSHIAPSPSSKPLDNSETYNTEFENVIKQYCLENNIDNLTTFQKHEELTKYTHSLINLQGILGHLESVNAPKVQILRIEQKIEAYNQVIEKLCAEIKAEKCLKKGQNCQTFQHEWQLEQDLQIKRQLYLDELNRREFDMVQCDDQRLAGVEYKNNNSIFQNRCQGTISSEKNTSIISKPQLKSKHTKSKSSRSKKQYKINPYHVTIFNRKFFLTKFKNKFIIHFVKCGHVRQTINNRSSRNSNNNNNDKNWNNSNSNNKNNNKSKLPMFCTTATASTVNTTTTKSNSTDPIAHNINTQNSVNDEHSTKNDDKSTSIKLTVVGNECNMSHITHEHHDDGDGDDCFSNSSSNSVLTSFSDNHSTKTFQQVQVVPDEHKHQPQLIPNSVSDTIVTNNNNNNASNNNNNNHITNEKHQIVSITKHDTTNTSNNEPLYIHRTNSRNSNNNSNNINNNSNSININNTSNNINNNSKNTNNTNNMNNTTNKTLQSHNEPTESKLKNLFIFTSTPIKPLPAHLKPNNHNSTMSFDPIDVFTPTSDQSSTQTPTAFTTTTALTAATALTAFTTNSPLSSYITTPRRTSPQLAPLTQSVTSLLLQTNIHPNSPPLTCHSSHQISPTPPQQQSQPTTLNQYSLQQIHTPQPVVASSKKIQYGKVLNNSSHINIHIDPFNNSIEQSHINNSVLHHNTIQNSQNYHYTRQPVRFNYQHTLSVSNYQPNDHSNTTNESIGANNTNTNTDQDYNSDSNHVAIDIIYKQ